MGKHNSKLKNDTLDRLTTETYCKAIENKKEMEEHISFGTLYSVNDNT